MTSIIILTLQKGRQSPRAEKAACLSLQKEAVLEVEIFAALGTWTCMQPLKNILFCGGGNHIAYFHQNYKCKSEQPAHEEVVAFFLSIMVLKCSSMLFLFTVSKYHPA